MKSFRRIFEFVKPYRWQAIIAIFLLVGMVASDLVTPRLTQRVLDQGVATGDMRVIALTSLAMVGVSLLGAAFAVANTILAVRVGQNTAADIRAAMAHKVQSLSFGNLDRLQTGQLIVRSTSDISQVQMMILMSMRMMMRAPLWLIGSWTLMLLTSPKLTLVIVAIVPLIAVIVGLFATKARTLFELVQKRLDKLNQVLQENLAGVRVVKAFVRVGFEQERFDNANENLRLQSTQVMKLLMVIMPLMMLTVNLGIIGAVWFGGNQVIAGSMTVGELVAFFNYLMLSLFPIVMLAGLIGPLSAADASAKRIYEVLDSEPDVVNTPVADMPQISGSVSALGHVVFDNVSFSYNGHSHEPVLCNVSLEAKPGQTVAILGATGSGKSTLIHLIPRFYDVSEGRVLLDGVDVRDLPLRELRQHVGVALQEAVLFSGTIRDNIRYGNPDASEEEVLTAAQAAQAHKFIMAMPDGYDTMVGQRGVNLSGGQKQRMSIARALLVKPRVLILDDSTSAVDVDTEAQIQDALEHLMKECTSFVIAQRISTVLNADEIVVMDDGRIEAIGTHRELLDRSPIYREIFESQLGNGGVAE